MAETRTTSSYGSWASPISAASLAKGAIGVSNLRAVDGRLYWLENRPDEGGRLVAVTGDATGFRVLTPEGFNVRSRVHEYGGAPYVVVGQTLYFASFTDSTSTPSPSAAARRSRLRPSPTATPTWSRRRAAD